jgi:hypothetical protein
VLCLLLLPRLWLLEGRLTGELLLGLGGSIASAAAGCCLATLAAGRLSVLDRVTKLSTLTRAAAGRLSTLASNATLLRCGCLEADEVCLVKGRLVTDAEPERRPSAHSNNHKLRSAPVLVKLAANCNEPMARQLVGPMQCLRVA